MTIEEALKNIRGYGDQGRISSLSQGSDRMTGFCLGQVAASEYAARLLELVIRDQEELDRSQMEYFEVALEEEHYTGHDIGYAEGFKDAIHLLKTGR